MPTATEAIVRVLSERVMLVLGLAVLPGALAELLLVLTPNELLILEAFDGIVVLVFVVEYLARLYVAPARGGYLLNGWSLLNLTIILLAFAGYVFASPILFATPVLRVLRLGRLVGESGRSSAEVAAFAKD